MNNSKILTIVMPVYNAAKYISVSLDSICESAFKDFEVILVENGSTDETLEILKSFVEKNHRFKLFSLQKKGLIEAMNFGINKSESKYIAIMDSDDICPNERFEKQIKYLEGNSEIILVGTSIYYFTDGKRNWRIKLPEEHKDILIGIEKSMQMLFNSTIMFRKEIAKKVGWYKLDDYPVPDLGFFLNMSKNGKLANLSDISQGIRLTNESFTIKHNMRIIEKQNILIRSFTNKNKSNFSKRRIKLSKIYYRKAIINYLEFKNILFLFYGTLTFLLKPINSFFYLKKKIFL